MYCEVLIIHWSLFLQIYSINTFTGTNFLNFLKVFNFCFIWPMLLKDVHEVLSRAIFNPPFSPTVLLIPLILVRD